MLKYKVNQIIERPENSQLHKYPDDREATEEYPYFDDDYITNYPIKNGICLSNSYDGVQ